MSCNQRHETKSINKNVNKERDNSIKLHQLKKLFVVGDFDGNGIQDTVFQHNYSKLTKSEVEYSADPFQSNWDTVVNWFYNQDVILYLTSNLKNQDTLNLGIAHGLYCLINIGDNNADGKDEIAFVIDYLDYSSFNTCNIITLCKGKWTILKSFGVNELSFQLDDENRIDGKSTTFDQINFFLEMQNGLWYYLDYDLQFDIDKIEDSEKMKLLKVDKCK